MLAASAPSIGSALIGEPAIVPVPVVALLVTMLLPWASTLDVPRMPSEKRSGPPLLPAKMLLSKMLDALIHIVPYPPFSK